MAITTKPAIKLEDFEAEMGRLAKTFSPEEFKNGFMKDAAESILAGVDKSFKNQADPDGEAWDSPATERKFGGRFAASYNTRPSGAKVTSGSKRLQDTGQFRKSWKVLLLSAAKLMVGPSGRRNEDIASAAVYKWGNQIGGFGKKQMADLRKIMKKYLKMKATQ